VQHGSLIGQSPHRATKPTRGRHKKVTWGEQQVYSRAWSMVLSSQAANGESGERVGEELSNTTKLYHHQHQPLKSRAIGRLEPPRFRVCVRRLELLNNTLATNSTDSTPRTTTSPHLPDCALLPLFRPTVYSVPVSPLGPLRISRELSPL
jgi:hypothetical protein